MATIFGSKAQLNTNTRLLAIGLGGTGTDTLLRVKDAILRRFDLSETDGRIPANIAFLGIDTDNGILDSEVNSTRLDKGKEFLLLEDEQIDIRFKNKKLLPAYIREWINPTLSAPETLGGGAAAVRQIGRYLLFHCYSQVKKKLKDLINDILKSSPMGDNLYIVLFSGISGGTGSGTFIDMGYIIRQVVQDMNIANITVPTAYLFLPDVNLAKPNLTSKSVNYIKRNGYAALKDLDYLMTIEEKQRKNSELEAGFCQTYGMALSDRIEVKQPPFDSVYLVSNISDPSHPIKNGYEYALNIVAESVVNYISKNVTAPNSSGPTAGLGLRSVDINGAQMINDVKAINPDGSPIIGNYCYKILGAATAEIPTEDVANYIARKFFEQIKVMLDRYPSATDLDDFIKQAKIEVPDMAAELKKQVQGKPQIEQIDPRNFKTRTELKAKFEQKLNEYEKKAVQAVNDNFQSVIKNLEERIGVNLNAAFGNIEKGPFFANRLLSGYKNVEGLQDQTGLINKVADNAMLAGKSREAARNKKNLLLKEAEEKYSAGKEAWFFGNRHFEDYKTFMLKACGKGIEEHIYDLLTNAYNKELLNYVKKQNKDIFDTYVSVLETLQRNFENITDLKIQGQQLNTMDGREYRWELINIAQLQSDLDAQFSRIDLTSIIQKFLEDMIDNSKTWLENKDQERVIQLIEHFIGENFKNILSTSMDNILGATYLSKKMDEEIRMLARNASVRFPQDKMVAFPGGKAMWESISVPFNSVKIKQMIDNYINEQGENIVPTNSSLTDRILWLKVDRGIPVFLYLYLKEYEMEYENNLGQDKGIHLYESEEKNWSSLPALVPEDIWSATGGQTYRNERVQKKNAYTREIFREAEKKDIVQSDENDYFAIITLQNTVQEKISEILQKYGMDRDNIMGSVTDEMTLKSCVTELKALENSSFRDMGKRYVIYKRVPSDGQFLEHNVLSTFIRMPELVKKVEEELDKRKAVGEIIRELESMASNFGRNIRSIELYIKGKICGVVHRSGLNILCKVGEEEAELCEIPNDELKEFLIYKSFMELMKNPVNGEEITKDIEAKAKSLYEKDEFVEKFTRYCTEEIKKLNAGILHKIQTVWALTVDPEVKNFYNNYNMALKSLSKYLESLKAMSDDDFGMF